MRGVGHSRGVAPDSVREVARYFFRLGCISFGGPAAHTALMRRELVQERHWVSDAELMDMLGAANLIPGPNSTELAMHIGARRAGWRGLWVAGLAFIVPAIAIVLGLAWAYVEYGTTAAGQDIMLGIQPFILAIIVQAIWSLRRAAVKNAATAVVGASVLVLAVAGVSEVVLILGGGVAGLIWGLLAPPPGSHAGGSRTSPVASVRRRGRGVVRRIARQLPSLRGSGGFPALVLVVSGYSAWELFLVFLKIGAVLYGSGYVLVAFLQADLVDSRHWLTNQQLIDAIAVGQFTPGPLFASATFAGYVIDGWRGALLASAGIFLPSFVFVSVTHRFVPRLRNSRWAAPFLDGVNVAALALMGLVTVKLARHTLDDAFAIVLFAVAAAVLVRFRPNSIWLVVAGGAAGVARMVVG